MSKFRFCTLSSTHFIFFATFVQDICGFHHLNCDSKLPEGILLHLEVEALVEADDSTTVATIVVVQPPGHFCLTRRTLDDIGLLTLAIFQVVLETDLGIDLGQRWFPGLEV